MSDSKIKQLQDLEEKRQQETLSLIPSENWPSWEVREALSSGFVAKYAEGYPGKRYYNGNRYVDELENLAIQRAVKLFGGAHANVQAYSGSTANLAVYNALMQPGDTALAMSLAHGGHLTHGHDVSFTGQVYNFEHYGVEKDGFIDYEKVSKLAEKHKPRVIVCGATAYPRAIDFEKFGEIARTVGAYLVADISHIAGLVAGEIHPHPFPAADVITTTTQKSLRGPRGALIISREKEIGELIDKAVFPGLQGGPHEHTIAAIAIALQEASRKDFGQYAEQVVKNAQTLAEGLIKRGFELVSGGTDNHLLLIDLTNKNITGREAADLLEEVGIVANRNTIPYETRTPFDPSGLRLGTPFVTTRGMQEKEMEELAEIIENTLEKKDNNVSQRVKELIKKFPLPNG